MSIGPDDEITLTLGRQRAVVSPWGAALRRYFFLEPDDSERDVVWGYRGGASKRGGQGDVLIPFPGRVADGRYEFEGRRYELERNDKEGPNAIHGFVRTMPWTVTEVSATHASFTVGIDEALHRDRGYPFSLSATVAYTLRTGKLDCSFSVRNTGGKTAPVGVGFHPYFTVGRESIDEAEVEIPARRYLEFGDRLVPTGKVLTVEGSAWDYRHPRRIDRARFNHCYLDLVRDPGRWCVVSLRDPHTNRCVQVAMDQAFTAVVVYTGDAIAGAPRRALAIEPMTCATDAFNHPEWGLTRLAPGQSFSGRYLIRAEGPPGEQSVHRLRPR